MRTRRLRIAVDDRTDVSGALVRPSDARALYVLAHGAGAAMDHPFLAGMAARLAAKEIATLRFNFPYTERGLRRPDRSPLLQQTVRAAVGVAARLAPGLPLIAGGKSMGGRMTSQAHAEVPLEGAFALVFLGFPLHPAGAPATTRGDHLAKVRIPMLFLQGDRDALADLALVRPLCASLGRRATLRVVAGADHGFSVLRRSGRRDPDIHDEMADAIAQWVRSKLHSGR